MCAAKYNEIVKSDGEALGSIKRAMLDADGPEVPVKIGDSTETLKFVEVHFSDLKTILREEQGAVQP